MTTDPLLKREQREQWETLTESVPSYLWNPIQEWISSSLEEHARHYDTGVAYERSVIAELVVKSRVDVDLDSLAKPYADSEVRKRNLLARLKELATTQPLQLFAFLDGICRAGNEAVADLERCLSDGGSAFAATTRGIERRVNETAKAAAENEINQTGSAANHLDAAWSAAYALSPSAATVYEESVKAVEAAMKPIFAPKDGAATLGKIISAARTKPTKWAHAIDNGDDQEIERTIGMAQLLWKGHERHGKNASVARNDIDEARAALHLAIVLVHWCRTSVIKLVGS